jgi:membrane protein
MSAIRTTRSIVGVVQEENVSFLAASVAYYAFFSIIPLLLLALAIGSLLGGQAFAQGVVSAVQGQLSSQGATVIEGALTSPTGRAGASVASLIALTWSALKVFRGLDLAFDEVYGMEPQTGLIEQVKDGLTVLVTVGLGVVLMIGLGVLLGRPTLLAIPYANLLGYVALVVGLGIVFLPLYYVMPPVDVSVREAIPGTVLLALGWIVLQAGFQVYAANAGDYQAYGLLGAILLFLTWLYFASMLVLVGAAVNAVLGGRNRPGADANTGADTNVSA